MNIKYKDLIEKLENNEIECSYIYDDEVVIKFTPNNIPSQTFDLTYEFDINNISDEDNITFNQKNDWNIEIQFDEKPESSVLDMLKDWCELCNYNGIYNGINFENEISLKIENDIIEIVEKYPKILDNENKLELFNFLLKENERNDKFETCILLKNNINKIKMSTI